MLRKSIPYKWALSLNVPTLRKRNLHRNKRGQWKKKTENLLSWCQISNRCEILINFGLSYLFLGLLDFLRKPVSAKIKKLAIVTNKDLHNFIKRK